MLPPLKNTRLKQQICFSCYCLKGTNQVSEFSSFSCSVSHSFLNPVYLSRTVHICDFAKYDLSSILWMIDYLSESTREFTCSIFFVMSVYYTCSLHDLQKRLVDLRCLVYYFIFVKSSEEIMNFLEVFSNVNQH